MSLLLSLWVLDGYLYRRQLCGQTEELMPIRAVNLQVFLTL